MENIKPVAIVVKDGNDYGLIESNVIQGITTLPIDTKLYVDTDLKNIIKNFLYDSSVTTTKTILDELDEYIEELGMKND